MNWHKALLLFLWVMPHALLGVLAFFLCKRRLYREFPVFFAYVLSEIAEFVLLFSLYSVLGVTSKPYKYAYCATLLLSIALRFGVINESAKDLFREYKLLRVSGIRVLQYATGLLLAVGVLLTVYAPGQSANWYSDIFVANRGAAMIQLGVLLSLLVFSRFMGLSWSRPAFGIALGLAILAGIDLVVHAIRSEFSSHAWVQYLSLLATGTYFVCVLIWIGYLLLPEPKPASIAVLPHDEVETWNTEFQRLLRAKD
ncbi:MAG: hypothetical protein WAL58_01115 [Terriglobales bacterium]